MGILFIFGKWRIRFFCSLAVQNAHHLVKSFCWAQTPKMLLQKPANVDLPWHGVSLHEIYGESLMINSGHLLLPLALHPLSAEVRIFLTLFLNQSALLQSHTTSLDQLPFIPSLCFKHE